MRTGSILAMTLLAMSAVGQRAVRPAGQPARGCGCCARPAVFFERAREADGSVAAPDEAMALRGTCTTALSLIADGSTIRSGPYKKELKAAVRWLMKRQDACGRFTDKSRNPNWLSDHALATYTFVVQARLARYKSLRARCGKAIRVLEATFHPEDERLTAEARVFATWAYVEARRFGLEVNKPSLARIREWSARQVLRQRRSELPMNESSALLMIRFLLAPDKVAALATPSSRLAMRMAKVKMTDLQPLDWFFHSFVSYHIGGATWKRCAARMSPLARRAGRRPDFGWSGEWDGAAGRYCTGALHYLSLTTYYRYCRLTVE